MSKYQEEQDIFISFTPRQFLRALSYRDFLTSITLGLLLHALFEVLDYYSSEELFEHTESLIRWILFILSLSLNHIVYRIEHRRSNNFIGRVIIDLIFAAGYTIIIVGHKLLIGLQLDLDTTFINALATGFAILVSVILFEICVVIIKRIFMLFKWQVF
jgi:hypothetical protein